MSYGGYEYGGGMGYGGGTYGYGGGGFDPMGGGGYDAIGGGGFIEDGTNKSPEKKLSKDKQSIIPVTIKQFNSSLFENDAFQLDGIDIHVVKIIGYVESLEEHTTNLTYIIRDGTGAVECKQWVEKNKSEHSKFDHIRPNTYVKIFGNPRDYEGKKHILIYDISKIEDWNEISYHSLDCILIHLQNTKGPINNSSLTSNKLPQTPFWKQDAFGRNGTPNVANLNINNRSVNNQPNQTMSLKTLVHDIIKSGDQSTGGYSITEIFDLLRKQGMSVTEKNVRDAINGLSNDGAIYSSVTDEHFLSLEGLY